MQNIDGVVLSSFGGSTLCDTDGVTWAITFTHNAGNIATLATVDFSIASSSSSSLSGRSDAAW